MIDPKVSEKEMLDRLEILRMTCIQYSAFYESDDKTCPECPCGQCGRELAAIRAAIEERGRLFCKADIDDIIAKINLPFGEPEWDAGWRAGVNFILRKFGIRLWDNFGNIDQAAIEKLRDFKLDGEEK